MAVFAAGVRCVAQAGACQPVAEIPARSTRGQARGFRSNPWIAFSGFRMRKFVARPRIERPATFATARSGRTPCYIDLVDDLAPERAATPGDSAARSRTAAFSLEPFRRIHPYWLMAIAWALLLALTKSTNLGDTKWYARNIVSCTRGDFRDVGSRLWEFGHL